jgi:hypothetical protein
MLLLGMFFLADSKLNMTGAALGSPQSSPGISSLLGLGFLGAGMVVYVSGEKNYKKDNEAKIIASIRRKFHTTYDEAKELYELYKLYQKHGKKTVDYTAAFKKAYEKLESLNKHKNISNHDSNRKKIFVNIEYEGSKPKFEKDIPIITYRDKKLEKLSRTVLKSDDIRRTVKSAIERLQNGQKKVGLKIEHLEGTKCVSCFKFKNGTRIYHIIKNDKYEILGISDKDEKNQDAVCDAIRNLGL